MAEVACGACELVIGIFPNHRASKLAIAYAATHWGNVINGGGTSGGVSTGFF